MCWFLPFFISTTQEEKTQKLDVLANCFVCRPHSCPHLNYTSNQPQLCIKTPLRLLCVFCEVSKRKCSFGYRPYKVREVRSLQNFLFFLSRTTYLIIPAFIKPQCSVGGKTTERVQIWFSNSSYESSRQLFKWKVMQLNIFRGLCRLSCLQNSTSTFLNFKFYSFCLNILWKLLSECFAFSYGIKNYLFGCWRKKTRNKADKVFAVLKAVYLNIWALSQREQWARKVLVFLPVLRFRGLLVVCYAVQEKHIW